MTVRFVRKYLLTLAILFSISTTANSQDKVLIFHLTKGYHHASIADGIIAITNLGTQNNFSVDTTTNPSLFNTKQLKKYKAIIFLSPTGDDFFNEEQKLAFQKFIHKGGGFVGIHAAADCLYKWDWYGKLVGGYFKRHPETQRASIIVTDSTHAATKHLSTPWTRNDEWYDYKNFNRSVKVLMQLDESSYKGGEMGAFHPISWYHQFEGGRVFYTGLGHTAESYTNDPSFLQHILGGIKYALKRKK